jgi:hypothetical protein
MKSGMWLSEIYEFVSPKCKCGYPNPRPVANMDTEMNVFEFVFSIFSIRIHIRIRNNYAYPTIIRIREEQSKITSVINE